MKNLDKKQAVLCHRKPLGRQRNKTTVSATMYHWIPAPANINCHTGTNPTGIN